jgi:Fe-S cluster assembly iron-binding protein IscA
MALDEPTDKDEIIEGEGFRLVVERELLAQVGDLHVDYIERGWSSGFSIRTASQSPDGCGGCSC